MAGLTRAWQASGAVAVTLAVLVLSVCGESYIGCHKDSRTRILKHLAKKSRENMTLDVCRTQCDGYTYFGIENGKECYCGNSLSSPEKNVKVWATDCNVPCSGDRQVFCGGGWRISVFHVPAVDSLDLCGSFDYKTDSNPGRAVSEGRGSRCDKDLRGWYRFTLNGTSATIPTTCQQYHTCGTGAPMWLDLEGGSLPAPGEEKQVKACASFYPDYKEDYTDSCCLPVYSQRITARNCGAYFIYLLDGTPRCNLAYCTEN